MKGETILCVATRRWESLWRDSQQVMSRLAANNRILYFEPGRNPDRSLFSEMRHNLRYFFVLHAQDVLPNITIIPTPSSLPYARQHLPRSVLRTWLPLVAHTNTRILAATIHAAMRKFNNRAPILWLYEPRDIGLAGRFGEKLVCYYNYDEYPEFVQNKRIKDMLRAYDNAMTRRADVVFATSRGQTERRQQINPNTHFIPNGVDFTLFNRALDPATTAPDDVRGLKRPIIGYAGWLGYQVDAALLLRVAQHLPDCTLLLVGPDCLPESESKRLLHVLPNVVFTGIKPVEELPRYLMLFNVALIPYVISGHTLTVYPLKLHEYLAAGRAVVATALPELRAFTSIIRVAESYDDYLEQVQQAMHDNGPAAITARVSVARQNTWDQRVAGIETALDSTLGAKGEQVEVEHGVNQVHRLDTLRPAP